MCLFPLPSTFAVSTRVNLIKYRSLFHELTVYKECRKAQKDFLVVNATTKWQYDTVQGRAGNTKTFEDKSTPDRDVKYSIQFRFA